MNDQTKFSALQRKAGAGRPRTEGAGMTPAKAFRLALSKAAQVELNLASRVLSVREEHLIQVQVLETLQENTMLMLLDGAQGSKGLAVFDPQFLAAVIEVQTIGLVSNTKASARRPTRTDSAMCEPFLDGVLQEFERLLEGGSAESWATGFRFDERIDSIRLLGLALEDIEYRMFRISLDLADGAKRGELLIVLPAVGSRHVGADASSADGWKQALEKTVCASHVEIQAVLHRAQLSLVAVTKLRPGDLVPVPKLAIAEVVMEGLDGRAVGRARLGQQNGFRALRIADKYGAAPQAVEPQIEALGDMPDITSDTAALPPIDAVATPAVDADLLANNTAVDIPMTPMDDLPMEEMADMAMGMKIT